MIRITRSGWRVSFAALSLAAAAAIGGTLAWADTPTTAPAVAPDHAAAVDAFKKAHDLFQQDKLPEANAENERALKLDPALPDALLLRRILQDKIAAGAGTPGAPGTATAPAGADKPRFLKPAEIAVLKVSEWAPDTDAQIRGTIDRKTLDAFWNEVVKKQGDPASNSKEAHDAFVNQANFAAQVKQIKDAGDPKYMEKVAFNTDPAALLNFKKNIQPYVMQNCATAACHAGDKAGNFKLYRPSNASDQTYYTNFYILSMYANADGKMIDRDHADASLLLQYGMIKDKAAKPHPGKAEVRFFSDSNDPRFQPMVAWIKSLAFPRPHYGIIYELPGAAPTTAPAPTPAPKTQPAPKPK